MKKSKKIIEKIAEDEDPEIQLSSTTSTFEKLGEVIAKVVPKEFKSKIPLTVELSSDNIPCVLHYEIPHLEISKGLYWVDQIDVSITWNETKGKKVSASKPLKVMCI